MIPISLNLKNKKVLVIGAGKVGRRKAQQLIQQSAQVTVMALKFAENQLEEGWMKLEKAYEKSDLHGMFLVCAATSDVHVNHQIVMDCQELSILCSSATYEQEASFHAMAYQQDQSWQIALTTGSPLISQEMVKLFASIAKCRQPRWQLEIDFRRLVLQRNPAVNHSEILLWLHHLSTPQLLALAQANHAKQVHLLVFHGASDGKASKPLKQLRQLVSQKDTACLVCFISQQALSNFVQRDVAVFLMQPLFQFAKVMGWTVKVEAMVLYNGEMMKRIQQVCPVEFSLTKPLVERGPWLLQTIQILKETYPAKKLVLISHELLPYPIEGVITKTIYDSELEQVEKETQILAFLLLPGSHAKSNCNLLKNQQAISLLENPRIIESLAMLIQHEL